MIREGGSHGGGAGDGEGERGVAGRQPGRGIPRPAEGRRGGAARRILVLEEEPVPRREDGGWAQEIEARVPESRCVAGAGYSSPEESC